MCYAPFDDAFIGVQPSSLVNDRRLVADGTSSIHDFPLVGGTALPYTTADLIIARLGSQYALIESTDDTGAGQINTTILNNVIAAITTEINGYLAPIYPIPPRRRGTVAIFQAVTVDSNGSMLTFQQPPLSPYFTTFYRPLRQPAPPNGYYYAIPTGTSPYATVGGNGTGCTMNVTFTTSQPFSVATASIASGGYGYVPYDIIGLVGGTSYLPAKISTAALALCCYALYARRLAPSEENQFRDEAMLWRGSAANPGELVKIGRGEVELDGDYPRLVSPGAAWVERNRLDMTTL